MRAISASRYPLLRSSTIILGIIEISSSPSWAIPIPSKSLPIPTCSTPASFTTWSMWSTMRLYEGRLIEFILSKACNAAVCKASSLLLLKYASYALSHSARSGLNLSANPSYRNVGSIFIWMTPPFSAIAQIISSVILRE